MTDLEQRVIDLIIKQTGFERTRVDLSSSLANDIGVDGDDAVEFFEKYGEAFHVDLAALHRHWDLHFAPEGVGFQSLPLLIIVGAAVVTGDLVHEVDRRIPLWASTITLLILFSWFFCKFLFNFFYDAPDKKIPITVQYLANSAASGTWVLDYTSRDIAYRSFA